MDQWHSVVHYWRLFFQIWAGFVCIATCLSAPIVLSSWKRVNWNIVDVLALFLPFATWLWLFTGNSEGKSLANLGEPAIIAFAVPVTVLIRVAVGKRFSRTVCSLSFVVSLSLFAACVYWFTPAWPE